MPRPEFLSFVITRRQLFDKIWMTPLAEFARDLGVEPEELLKICRDLNIPCPPADYWEHKRAGLKVVHYRLP